VEAAVDILRQRRCRGLLLSGGAVRNERSEALTMAAYAALAEPDPDTIYDITDYP
jgi:vancomycin permeability regulator SanA